MKRKIVTMSEKLMLIGLFVMVMFGSSALAAAKVKHAIIGSIEAIDSAAKTIVVKTAERKPWL